MKMYRIASNLVALSDQVAVKENITVRLRRLSRYVRGKFVSVSVA